MERKRETSQHTVPQVSEAAQQYIEAHIPKTGLEREFYTSLLNLRDIEGRDYGHDIVSKILTAKEGYHLRILGTPSAGKTTVRLQLKGMLEDRSYGLRQRLVEIPERRVQMWTFDSYMRACARERGLGPVSKWTPGIYEQADEYMVEDVDQFRNSEESAYLAEQGFIIDYVDEIPYVHNEFGQLLGERTVKKASQTIQEEITTKGYSTSQFLILLPDMRTLQKGIEFRRTAIERQGDEISGTKNGLTLQDELAQKGFYFVGEYPRGTDINRLIYQNARRSAPPEIVTKLHNRELSRAQEYYYNTSKTIPEQKRAQTIFKRIQSQKGHSRGLSEELYGYLKQHNPDEIIRLGVLAAYYDAQMQALGVPEENYSIAVNEFRNSYIAGNQMILVRLDNIDAPTSIT